MAGQVQMQCWASLFARLKFPLPIKWLSSSGISIPLWKPRKGPNTTP